MGGSGRGPGGGKRFPKLNRNGYMFLAFVAVCLIIFIVLISAIVRSCGKKEGGDETEETTTTVTEETTTLPVETTAAPAGPNDPMGVFVFSDQVGYRSWWDLFHTAYGIDIENESDPRIDRVLAYNGLTRDTFPAPIQSGTQLILPPVDMLDSNVELVPYVTSEAPADTQAPEETAAEETAAEEN